MTDYNTYIRSSAWRRTRERYWNSGLPTDCYVCGNPRHKGMHLHHRAYKNLGHERLMDLVPLCEWCHEYVHQLYDANPKWKRDGLWFATKTARKQVQGGRTMPAQGPRQKRPKRARQVISPK